MSMVSDCCGVEEREGYVILGVCSKCKEYCTYVDIRGRGPLRRPSQLEEIDALLKAWVEQATQEAADEAEWLREHEQERIEAALNAGRFDTDGGRISD